MTYLYKLDEIYTNRPIKFPSLYLFIKCIEEIFGLNEKMYFDVYVCGGFLSNHSHLTTDIDLYVNLKKEYSNFSSDICRKHLRNFLIKSTLIGFKYDLYLDLTYTPQNAVESLSNIYSGKNIVMNFVKFFNKVTRITNGKKEVDYYMQNPKSNVNKWFDCYLIIRDNHPKIKKYLEQGRIYYKPTLIEEYYRLNGPRKVQRHKFGIRPI